MDASWMDKSCWGPGPWQNEPDRLEWRDEATGLVCLARRNHFGNWCGYVGVPPGHPWHGRGYGDLDEVEVHGGLTYASECDDDPSLPEEQRVCHRPDQGEPEALWWLGFDCGHHDDLSPGIDSTVRRGFALYRDLDYVRRECEVLAGQVAEAS